MSAVLSIDLNCDVGEGCDSDEQIMPYITSANIACGFHASSPLAMWAAVKLCARHGVAIGAHPSYPDMTGFGRRAMQLTPEQICADVAYQIGALWAFCRMEGVRLHHVKAHGALYNKAAQDREVAEAIAKAIQAVDAELIMVCLSSSAMVVAAQQTGIRYVEEAFADRAYTKDGSLVPRGAEGAVLQDADEIALRTLEMVRSRSVFAVDGMPVPLNFETICVHGDTPGAIEIVKAIRRRLQEEHVAVKAFGDKRFDLSL